MEWYRGNVCKHRFLHDYEYKRTPDIVKTIVLTYWEKMLLFLTLFSATILTMINLTVHNKKYTNYQNSHLFAPLCTVVTYCKVSEWIRLFALGFGFDSWAF